MLSKKHYFYNKIVINSYLGSAISCLLIECFVTLHNKNYTLLVRDSNLLYMEMSFLQNLPLRGANFDDVVYHRMAHYVLIRCFLQPSLAEALNRCNFFSIRLNLPLRGAKLEGRLSPHGALRAYTVFLTAEPRRGS